MKGSRDRIITSHVGSLPRPDDLIEANRRREDGEGSDERAFEALLQGAVTGVVRHQKAAGVDVPNDGEFGKSMGHAVNYRAWLSYAFTRLSGLQHDNPPDVPPRPTQPGDLAIAGMPRRRDRTKFAAAYNDPNSHISIGPQPFVRPICIGPVKYIGQDDDQGRYRALQDGAQGKRRRGRLHDRDRARRRRAARQHPLQDRRRVPVRLRRCHARGIQGDRRCRPHPPARRSRASPRTGTRSCPSRASRPISASPWSGSRR